MYRNFSWKRLRECWSAFAVWSLKGGLEERWHLAASNYQGFVYMSMRNWEWMIPSWYLRLNLLLGRHHLEMLFLCGTQTSLSCRTLRLRGFWQQALSPSLPSQCQICQVSRSPLQESLALGTVALREVKEKQQLGLSVMQRGFGYRNNFIFLNIPIPLCVHNVYERLRSFRSFSCVFCCACLACNLRTVSEKHLVLEYSPLKYLILDSILYRSWLFRNHSSARGSHHYNSVLFWSVGQFLWECHSKNE